MTIARGGCVQVSADQPIDPRQPVRLADAVKLFFPFGGVTVATLRTEIRKGRLAVERIGNKDFVTGEAIARMRELCRVEPKVPVSVSSKRQAATPSGSSATDQLNA